MKTPTWITAGFAQKFAGENGANFHYTAKQKEEFAKNPDLFLKYSKMIESELNQRFKFILKNTKDAKAAKDFAANEMMTKLNGNKELIEAMVPKHFGVGCRRPTPGNGFLVSLHCQCWQWIDINNVLPGSFKPRQRSCFHEWADSGGCT